MGTIDKINLNWQIRAGGPAMSLPQPRRVLLNDTDEGMALSGESPSEDRENVVARSQILSSWTEA